MIWGTVQVAIILCISGSLKSFDLVYIMTKGGPAHATELLATYMYNSTFNTYRYGFGECYLDHHCANLPAADRTSKRVGDKP